RRVHLSVHAHQWLSSYIMTYFTEYTFVVFFFFSSRRRHTRSKRDWSSDVCSSDLYVHLVWNIMMSVKKTSSMVQKLSRRITSLRSEEHTSELQSRFDLVCRLLLEKKNPTDRGDCS